MSESKHAQYFANVKEYAKDYREEIVEGVAKHCGIALRNKDSSLVSCSDPKELARVRDGFCRKKMARTDSDADVDAVLAKVCEIMKPDRQKSRVTFYYLVAEQYGMLDAFAPKK